MKKIFIWLLKKYSKDESGRVEIIKTMDQNLQNEYCEQTKFGNVYNYFTEFIIANEFINKCAIDKDRHSLNILKKGIGDHFDDITKRNKLTTSIKKQRINRLNNLI